jgi:hypothetical protein
MAGLPWPGWAPPDAEAWLKNAFADPPRAARTRKAVGHKQKYSECYGRRRWDSSLPVRRRDRLTQRRSHTRPAGASPFRGGPGWLSCLPIEELERTTDHRTWRLASEVNVARHRRQRGRQPQPRRKGYPLSISLQDQKAHGLFIRRVSCRKPLHGNGKRLPLFFRFASNFASAPQVSLLSRQRTEN